MINFTKKRKAILLIIFALISIFFITRFGRGWNTLFSDPIAAIIVTIFGLIMLSLAVAIIGVFCVDKILLPIINLFIKKAPSANREQLESIIDDLFKRISKTHSVATKALLKNFGKILRNQICPKS